MWQNVFETGKETECFSWDLGGCGVVSLVGGGGKTTLMNFLARCAEARRENVLVTTTTHLQIPQSGNLAFSLEEVHRLWSMGRYAVLGTLGEHRLGCPDQRLLEEVLDQADLTLIEADGSKCRPCKVPREHEPVILPETDLVIAVLGMSAVGKPLIQGCFHPELVAQFLGKQETDCLTEADAARILSSRDGSRKGAQDCAYWVVLNQCDDSESRGSGARIARMLLDQGVDRVILTSFTREEQNQFEMGYENE